MKNKEYLKIMGEVYEEPREPHAMDPIMKSLNHHHGYYWPTIMPNSYNILKDAKYVI